MFTSQILPILKWRIRRPMNFRVPIKFDPRYGRLTAIQSSSKDLTIQRYKYKLKCILPILYTLTLAINLIFGSFSTVQRLQGAVFLMLCVLTSTAGWNCGVAPVQVVNTFLDFETGW